MKNGGNHKACHYWFYFIFFSFIFTFFNFRILRQCLVPDLKDEADSSKLDVYILL